MHYAGIAQLVEQLNRNQHVGGSSPLAGSIFKRFCGLLIISGICKEQTYFLLLAKIFIIWLR
jgi:hypothetical protein